ncbi:MAG: hypothetical protein VX834_04330 [Myxococcota bacterium]|nr:hypothetical protein [Myxococcota bacterium]
MWLKSLLGASMVAVLCLQSSACVPPEEPPAAPACTHETPLKPGVPGSPGHLIASPANPNGQSELAHLMRAMLHDMQDRRDALRQGKTPAPLKDFTKMKCAWPTADGTRSAHFDRMADVMLATVSEFNQDTTSSVAFNQVVGSCLACHQTACPGPMAAIRPLHWSPESKPLPDPEVESCAAPIP